MIDGAQNHGFIRKVGIFLLFQLLFGVITFPLFVFYGPFENVKRTIVDAAMTTYDHQYIATIFLSENAINRIRNYNYLDVSFLDNDDNIGISIAKFDKQNFNDNIEIFNIDGGNFDGKLMVINDPTRVYVGYSNNMPKSGETTSSIAKRNKSVAAINAGGFVDKGWEGTGGAPTGFVIHKGNTIYDEKKNVNTRQDTIAITEKGVMIVGRHSIKQLLALGVREGVSFGPPLIIDGKGTITKGDGGWGIAPRAAIAQRKDGAIMFLTIDGRSISSLGATLKDVQEIFLQHNAITAANLDGGSSTTMYYNGKIINKLSDALGERTVPTVFMVDID